MVRGRTLHLRTRRTRRDAVREKRPAMPQPAVIDGGFDYFIRDNWTRPVDDGQTLAFRFVATKKLDYFRFTVRRVGTTTVAGIRCARLKLSASSLIASFFVDPIVIACDLNGRRLTEYRGMSNINDARGRSHNARIVFTYPWMRDAERPPAADAAASAGAAQR